MTGTVESIALEFANNAIEGLATCELSGIPAGMEESVREAIDGIVAVPAAELARLREIERCARDFLRVYDDSAIVLFHRYTPPLRAALAPKDDRRGPSPAAFHGSVPDDSGTGF